MPLLRPTKPAWLALFLGLSLLLNLALVLLLVLLRNQQPAQIAQHRADDQPADPADALKKAADLARVHTNGLPAGYSMILRGHPGSISAICFAPDSTRLALTTNRGYIAVWNLGSPAIDWETIIPGDQGYGLLNPLAFSPAGDQLAYAVAVPVADGSRVRTSFTVHIRDLQTGREKTIRDDQAALGLGGCLSLAFSPDGQTVAVGCLRGVAVFDSGGGPVRGILRAERRFYYKDLNYSANGTSLLAATLPGISLFDIRSGKLIADLKLTSQNRGVRKAVLSPDASRIATGSSDNGVTLWDTSTSREITHITEGAATGFSAGSCWIEFTSDGKSIMTASRGDDSSRIFARRRNPMDGSLVSKVEVPRPGEAFSYFYPRLFAPDGNKLALIGVKTVDRHIPQPDMAFITADEEVVAIFDTSQLFDGRPPTLSSRHPVRRSRDSAATITNYFFPAAPARNPRSTESFGSVDTGPSRHSHRIISGMIAPPNFCPCRFIPHE